MTILEASIGVTKLGLDTSPFIYYVEDSALYSELCDQFFQQIDEGKIEGVTSTLTLTEALILPLRNQEFEKVQLYRTFLGSTPGIRLVPVDFQIANKAADLRVRYNLKTPDALQVATALMAGCEAFLTNDKGLRRVTELRVLVLDDLLDP